MAGFAGRVALITGEGRGIESATAELLAPHGTMSDHDFQGDIEGQVQSHDNNSIFMIVHQPKNVAKVSIEFMTWCPTLPFLLAS